MTWFATHTGRLPEEASPLLFWVLLTIGATGAGVLVLGMEDRKPTVEAVGGMILVVVAVGFLAFSP
jgi:hypothetical protein